MPPKKNKPKTTVNVDAVKREVKKLRKSPGSPKGNFSPVPEGFGESPPGVIKRESPLEQDMGPSPYRQMIHDHNQKNKHILDRLPFQFPKKKKIRSHLDITVLCSQCNYEQLGSENTVGFVCPKCKEYVSAKNPEAEARGYNPDLKVGFRGTATDKLALKEDLGKKNNQ